MPRQYGGLVTASATCGHDAGWQAAQCSSPSGNDIHAASPTTVRHVSSSLSPTVRCIGSGATSGRLSRRVARCAAWRSRITALTSDGKRFGATVASTDLTRDLALLVPDLKLPQVEMDPASGQRQGDQLLVLGYPRPSILGVGGPASLTRGLLSAVRQENGVTYIQTDATINPGNSGGPVLNMRGNVVGVVDFTLKDSIGLNFAIATESIQAFLAAPASIAQPPTPTSQAVTATPMPRPPA